MNILHQIKETALRFPDRAVFINETDCLSYKQLEETSNRLALAIQQVCGSDKTPIPVYGHKHPFMLICFLACVKSGRGYCPIDVSVPWARTESIIKNMNAPILFACEPLPKQDSLNDFSSRIFQPEDLLKTVPPLPEYEHLLPSPVCGNEIFYIIFTSGSTGSPKGVQITSDCLNHYLDWSVNLGNSKKEKDGKIFLNQAPFSFDLSVMDLYTCLACGGTLFTLSREVQADFSKLIPALKRSDASVWVSTPSFADLCLTDPSFTKELLPHLDVFLFCGETLGNRTVSKLHKRFPDTIVMNTYGPTESTVAVTEVKVTPDLNASCQPLPVGKAKPGTLIEIHDENGTILPEETVGEIIILGNTVSAGYYRQPELTKKAFFTCVREGQIMRGYKTGDKGYLKNGSLYYCGRIDLQIKLHGYRIELEDIEQNLLKLPSVEHAAAIANVKNGKVKSIAAFVVCNESPSDLFAFSQKIKQELKQYLPEYMIPKKIVFLKCLPMTSNGKIDRKALEGMLS